MNGSTNARGNRFQLVRIHEYKTKCVNKTQTARLGTVVDRLWSEDSIFTCLSLKQLFTNGGQRYKFGHRQARETFLGWSFARV